MQQTELQQYQAHIRHRLRSIAPVFARAAIGDFSKNVEVPESEDELTEFFVGVQIILEAIREKVGELEASVHQLQAANDIIANEKARAEAILNSLGEGVMTVDKDGKVTFTNRPALELLGQAKEIHGKDSVGLFALEDKNGEVIPLHLHPVAHVLHTSVQVVVKLGHGPEYYLNRSSNNKIRIAFTMTPIKLENQTTGAVIVFRDITQESNTDHAKDEIISIASHQLRTPLTAIRWYAKELLASYKQIDEEKMLSYLQQIRDSNQRMTELVERLLSVSRIDLGTLTVRPEFVKIDSVVAHVVADLTVRIKTKHLSVVQHIPPDTPPVYIDPHALHMIVQNVVGNAVEYSFENKTVTISAAHADGHVVFTVKDQGCGIPAKQQGQIFGKLFRADNAQQYSSQDSGLGLYITKALVERSCGTIRFESAENEGTTMIIALPTNKGGTDGNQKVPGAYC